MYNVTGEILEYLRFIEKYKEEQKLFQFLNGLDELYAAQRSQILLMTPLPNADVACNMMQQEEAHREVLDENIENADVVDLYGNSNSNANAKCGTCGKKWHPKDKCWELIGYLDWY